MPGTRLNDTEHHLQFFWASLGQDKDVYLKKIIINSQTPIRGIKKCTLDIKYPITVLCGKNGSGKSTLLQLAVLAFHHADKNKRKTFKDFFYKTKYDPENNHIALTWSYSKGNDISVLKGSKKWMHYERRPVKEVCFIAPRDILLTQGAHGKRGVDNAQDSAFIHLNSKYLSYLSEILEKPYTSAEEVLNSDISKCSQKNTIYSCLNMGVGERVIIHILKIFQEASVGAIIGIDEIEMGIHPFALRKLAEKIQEITKEKKLQVFITTHSRDFLDALPRDARVLVERSQENEVTTINAPTTMYAISKISNKLNAELIIYCEDSVAATLIKLSSRDLLTRIDVIPAGGKSELAKILNHHLLSKHPAKGMIYWDGDVSEEEITDYVKDFKEELIYDKFKSQQCPEKDILDALETNQNNVSSLANALHTSEEEIEQTIQTCKTTPDAHNIFYIFSERTNLDKKIIEKALIDILIATKKEISDDIYNKIKSILNKPKGQNKNG